MSTSRNRLFLRGRIENPLAQRLLVESFGPGDVTGVEARGAKLVFYQVKGKRWFWRGDVV